MSNETEPKALPDEVIYDLLLQLPLNTTDDQGEDIPGVYQAIHGSMSLQDLVTAWIYDALKMPDAPEVDYDDPDFDEILGYLDANIPTYIEALCQVVYNWDKVGESEDS